jgi:hypothetical protein
MTFGQYEVEFIRLFTQNVRRRIYAQITPSKNDPGSKVIDSAFDAVLELIVSIKKDGQEVSKTVILEDMAVEESEPILYEAIERVKPDPTLYESLSDIILGKSAKQAAEVEEAKKN